MKTIKNIREAGKIEIRKFQQGRAQTKAYVMFRDAVDALVKSKAIDDGALKPLKALVDEMAKTHGSVKTGR